MKNTVVCPKVIGQYSIILDKLKFEFSEWENIFLFLSITKLLTVQLPIENVIHGWLNPLKK